MDELTPGAFDEINDELSEMSYEEMDDIWEESVEQQIIREEQQRAYDL